jgi:UDPglucose 6-dehydrogenase
LQYTTEINDCLRDADIVLHLTEWKIYREIDPKVAHGLVKSARIIDGRNALDREAWVAAGWKFRALGRS